MLKIIITAVKSMKLGYRLIIEIQIIHFCPKSHYDPGLKRKLESKNQKISPWTEYRIPWHLAPERFRKGLR